MAMDRRTAERAILVLNAGSSSLKFSLYGRGDATAPPVLHGQIEGLLSAPRFAAHDADGSIVDERRWDSAMEHDRATALTLEFVLSRLGGRRLAAVGHRVVHGGTTFDGPVMVDTGVVEALEALIPLAPLHQPHNVAPIRALRALAPDLPQIACFDTAFHRGQPAVAQAFALPERITAAGVRRYGFHGLSYESIARRLPDVDPVAAAGRTVVLHLGNGASLCAMAAGRSVASSMGFTALDGLPMGTRCGALDPGVVLHLLDGFGMDVRQVEHLLYHESGLLGVSGISSDMRVLEASDDPRAAAAIDLLVHRITREIGASAAVLGGLDAIVFTAGIGENSARLRAAVCTGAAWLGVVPAPAANAVHGPLITTPDSPVRAWVIATDEEGMIASHVAGMLSAAGL
jgi:acetate kinase